MTPPAYPKSAGAQAPANESTNESANCRSFDSTPPASIESLRGIGPEYATRKAHDAIGGAFPRFIESAVAKVREQLVDLGRGPLVDAIAATLEGRRRGMKEEARKNTASALTALLYGMDAASLFVRTPKAGGLPERHRWAIYDARAFGPQIEGKRSIKRTFRASAKLQDAGLLQVRELGEIQGTSYKSHIAHKRITLELFRLLGLLNAWKKLRRDREKEMAREKARRAERMAALSLRKKKGGNAAPVAAVASTPAPAPAAPKWAAPKRSPDELAAFLAAQKAAAGLG